MNNYYQIGRLVWCESSMLRRPQDAPEPKHPYVVCEIVGISIVNQIYSYSLRDYWYEYYLEATDDLVISMEYSDEFSIRNSINNAHLVVFETIPLLYIHSRFSTGKKITDLVYEIFL